MSDVRERWEKEERLRLARHIGPVMAAEFEAIAREKAIANASGTPDAFAIAGLMAVAYRMGRAGRPESDDSRHEAFTRHELLAAAQALGLETGTIAVMTQARKLRKQDE